MNTSTVVVIGLALTACGRIRFDARTDAGSDGAAAVDALVDALVPQTNLVFLTSGTIVPGQLGSLAVADEFCNDIAHAGDDGGTFVAWLSTSTVNAIDRLGGARGWVRRDGKPFADTPADIAAGVILYPPELDERGSVRAAQPVTGTTTAGTVAAGATCIDYTDNSPSAIATGESTSTSGYFSRYVSLDRHCNQPSSLYCFEIDYTTPVAPTPLAGRVIFETAPWLPAGGIGAADSLCAQTAASAGLTGSFLAMLATSTASIASRFTDTGAPVVRRDGVEVATSVTALMNGDLIAPPNVDATGTVYGSSFAWVGAPSPTLVAATTIDCNDWGTAAATAIVGTDASASGCLGSDTLTGSGVSDSCSVMYPIYCLAIP